MRLGLSLSLEVEGNPLIILILCVPETLLAYFSPLLSRSVTFYPLSYCIFTFLLFSNFLELLSLIETIVGFILLRVHKLVAVTNLIL